IEQGCDQVVFLDAAQHRFVEELGGMNVFFVFDDGSMMTPPLSGTILPGITRDSVITLARREGRTVREERYSIEQWRADAASGKLREVFACGTAAVISAIGKIKSASGHSVIFDRARKNFCEIPARAALGRHDLNADSFKALAYKSRLERLVGRLGEAARDRFRRSLRKCERTPCPAIDVGQPLLLRSREIGQHG